MLLAHLGVDPITLLSTASSSCFLLSFSGRHSARGRKKTGCSERVWAPWRVRMGREAVSGSKAERGTPSLSPPAGPCGSEYGSFPDLESFFPLDSRAVSAVRWIFGFLGWPFIVSSSVLARWASLSPAI